MCVNVKAHLTAELTGVNISRLPFVTLAMLLQATYQTFDELLPVLIGSQVGLLP